MGAAGPAKKQPAPKVGVDVGELVAPGSVGALLTGGRVGAFVVGAGVGQAMAFGVGPTAGPNS